MAPSAGEGDRGSGRGGPRFRVLTAVQRLGGGAGPAAQVDCAARTVSTNSRRARQHGQVFLQQPENLGDIFPVAGLGRQLDLVLPLALAEFITMSARRVGTPAVSSVWPQPGRCCRATVTVRGEAEQLQQAPRAEAVQRPRRRGRDGQGRSAAENGQRPRARRRPADHPQPARRSGHLDRAARPRLCRRATSLGGGETSRSTISRAMMSSAAAVAAASKAAAGPGRRASSSQSRSSWSSSARSACSV